MKGKRTTSTENRIDQVKKWLKEFARAGMDKVHIEKDTGIQDNGEWAFTARLYTATCYYDITAIDRQGPSSYLGCFAHCRYPLLGEHWRRGNDLADGPLTRETWERIKNDIISYELVDPAPKQTSITATFENFMFTLRGVLNSIEKVPGGFPAVSIPPKVKENAIDLVQSVLELVPMKMLPEIIASEDDCLSTAAAHCTGQHTPKEVAFE